MQFTFQLTATLDSQKKHFVKYKNKFRCFLCTSGNKDNKCKKKYYWKVQRFLQGTWFRSELWLLVSVVLVRNYSSKATCINIMRFLMFDAECTCNSFWSLFWSMCVMIWLDTANMALPPQPSFKSNVCWIACNCFFKVHSCTGVHVSSTCTQATPDLFSDQTSLLSLSIALSLSTITALSVTHLLLLTALRLNRIILLRSFSFIHTWGGGSLQKIT